MPEPKVRVNWTIPVPVILAILAQAALLGLVIGSWKATIESNIDLIRQEAAQRSRDLEARLAVLEKNAAGSIAVIERVKGLEVNVQVLKEQSENIEHKIDRLIDRGSK
jgi:hypothetical protein